MRFVKSDDLIERLKGLTNRNSNSFAGMHINKVLYTVSYMSVTAGAAGLLFTGIYLMVLKLLSLISIHDSFGN